MPAQSAFEREIADLIVSTLNLEEVSAAEIDPDAPLFGDGLGLDSIDALELAVAIASRYDVHLRAEDESTRQVFASLRNLAQHVAQSGSAARSATS